MKRTTPLRTRTRLRRTTGLAPVSRKRHQAIAELSKARREALTRDGGRCQRCGAPADDVHHRRGRVGADLLDLDLLVSVCRPCHEHIESHRAEAYEQGWLLRRNTRRST